MHKRFFFTVLLVFLISKMSYSQILEINKSGTTESTFTPQELIEKVLITGNCARISDFTSKTFGTETSNTIKSYGYFKKPVGSGFPFEKGIILTTGNAFRAGNTKTDVLVDNVNGLPGDLDLEKALGIGRTQDATFVKFNFIPFGDKISFRFLMASEEYNGATECNFADGFAFLLREIGTTNYTNLAVLPDISKTPVSVTNINNAPVCRANLGFFEGYNLGDTNYGGRTKVLTATAAVVPNKTYEIKLVVADQGDSEWDSAVFLEAGSFNLGADLGKDFLKATNTAVCSTTQILDAQINAISYKWYKDNVLIPGETAKTYVANLGDGTYKLEAEIGTGCVSVDEVELEFVKTSITKPNDWEFCDKDNDGINAFDLKAKMDTEILNGQDATLYTVSYFSSKAEAESNTNPLPNPYTNKVAYVAETIYAKVTNNSSTNCFQITDFQITINNLPIPQTPSDYSLCDDKASGSNMDGFTTDFLLLSKDAEILGTLMLSDHMVSYHTSLLDAQNNTAAINKNIPYKNTVANSQTIYVRVTNVNGCSNETTSFNLTVIKVPVISANLVYEQCDVDTNPIDGIAFFNLETIENKLLTVSIGSAVDFFEITDTSFLSPINKTSYRNTLSPFNHKITVRVINNTTGCYQLGEISLQVNSTSLNTYPDMYACEIDLNTSIPGSVSSNGSGNASFDFTSKINEIIAGSGGVFSLATHTFQLYKTANDASLQVNEIVAPFNNYLFVNNSDIFVRISSISSNVCSGIGQFKVFINERPVPIGNTSPIYLCLNNPIDNPQLITVDLNAGTGVAADTYQWFLNGSKITGAINAIYRANRKGTYRVEAYRIYQNIILDTTDDSSCSGYNTFTVLESNKALITSVKIVDNQLDTNDNKIEIEISGMGDYEYALNSTSLGDFNKGTNNLSFVFEDIKPGLNTVYIRDRNGCGIINSQQLSFLFFQRHFSPNNDGYFDTWKVFGATGSFYSVIKVEVFDRYGKLLTVIDQKTKNGWNGTFKGKELPSNDYWFNATLIEEKSKSIRKKSGHFSLIRK